MDDPAESWRVVRDELSAYGAGLELKPEIVALTKSDMPDAKALKKVIKALEIATGAKVFPVSAPLEEGLEPLLDAVIESLALAAARQEPEAAAEGRPWSPL